MAHNNTTTNTTTNSTTNTTTNSTTNSTNRRLLATPSSNPKTPSMESNSAHKKNIPELTKLFSSLNTNHRFHTNTTNTTINTTNTTINTTNTTINTTNRRMLATPSSKPKTPSMDSNSTHKKHIPELTKLFSSLNTNHRFLTTTKNKTHMPVSSTAEPEVQTLKKLSKNPSKQNDAKGSINPQEIVKLQYPIKEEKEEIKRLSSGAIVKIKELNVSYDEMEQHDCKKRPSMDVQRRRSCFCGSNNNVELSDFLSSNGARIVSVDMPPFMQIHAVGCARKACDSLEKFTSKALALTLKKEFDGIYGPAWHCIVGSSFGSFVTHSVGGFLYFSLDHKLYVLLFKTSVQKAD